MLLLHQINSFLRNFWEKVSQITLVGEVFVWFFEVRKWKDAFWSFFYIKAGRLSLFSKVIFLRVQAFLMRFFHYYVFNSIEFDSKLFLRWFSYELIEFWKCVTVPTGWVKSHLPSVFWGYLGHFKSFFNNFFSKYSKFRALQESENFLSRNPSKVLKNSIQSFNKGKKDLKNFFQIRKEHGQKRYYPKNLKKI